MVMSVTAKTTLTLNNALNLLIRKFSFTPEEQDTILDALLEQTSSVPETGSGTERQVSREAETDGVSASVSV